MFLHTIKSEFRKLLTLRSTRIMLLLALVITVGMSFYFEGYKGNTGSAASLLSPNALKEIIANGGGIAATFISLIAILLVCHEYRYNMILNTLTANAKRTQVFMAKVLTVSLFSLIAGMVITWLAVGAYMLGLSFRDASLPAQNFELLYELGRMVAYFVGYGLMGLVLGFLIRSVVGAIAFFFIVPATIEGLLGAFVLKENAVYLPFTALDSIMGSSFLPFSLAPGKAVLVAFSYISGLMIISWYLFLKRDAN